jgi:hypothetical protein
MCKERQVVNVTEDGDMTAIKVAAGAIISAVERIGDGVQVGRNGINLVRVGICALQTEPVLIAPVNADLQ